MKKIEAIVKPFKLDDVKEALAEVGIVQFADGEEPLFERITKMVDRFLDPAYLYQIVTQSSTHCQMRSEVLVGALTIHVLYILLLTSSMD